KDGGKHQGAKIGTRSGRQVDHGTAAPSPGSSTLSSSRVSPLTLPSSPERGGEGSRARNGWCGNGTSLILIFLFEFDGIAGLKALALLDQEERFFQVAFPFLFFVGYSQDLHLVQDAIAHPDFGLQLPSRADLLIFALFVLGRFDVFRD